MTGRTPMAGFVPDSRLPQRDVLLDAQAMQERLELHPTLRAYGKITSCERRRGKYRVGESLRVLYRVTYQHGEYVVSARAFAAGTGVEAQRKAVATGPECRRSSPLFYDAELETLFWLFPQDRKLPSLPVLLSVPRSLAYTVNIPWVTSRVVAYAPEKSAIAQCLDTDEKVLAYGKMYAGEEGLTSVRNHCALFHSLPVDDPVLRLPRVLGYVAPYRLLFLEPQQGQRITDVAGDARLESIRQLGRALARFHQLPPSPALSRFARLDCDRLQHAAALVGQARPDVAPQAAQVLALLVQWWRQPTTAAVCLHGDVHAKNGIVQDERIALIDLDQVALGPAAAEVGSFFASLHYWCCLGVITQEDVHSLEAAFLDGYAMMASLPDIDSVRWYTAAALLAERALRAVNRVREQGLLHLPKILTTASALLSERGQ